MFSSILSKSVASSTPATIKSFNRIHRPLISLFSGILMDKSSYLSSASLIKRSLLSFSSHGQHRFLSKDAQQPFEPTDHSQPLDEPKTLFFDNIDYDAITRGDAELTKMLKIIVAEAYVLYEEGKEIPSKVTNDQFKELLELKSRSARHQFLRYLFVTERKKEAERVQKLAKREEFEKYLKERSANVAKTTESSDGELNYKLASNSLFLRIYDTSIDRYNNFTLCLAAMFGPKVIVDCGYSSHMIKRESRMCAKQLMLGFADNRKHISPAHLVFCNYNKEDLASKELFKYIPTMYEPHFPLEFHSESYLDLYPREKLVYLTPHCQDVVHAVGGDDIFIIGGMVDKVSHEKASLAKAKKEGLRMAKFPIDQYLDWGSGVKNLTINQCILILTDMYWKHDWKFAFDRWVPKRKLMSNDHVAYASKMRKRLDNDALNIFPKFSQMNKYDRRFNRSNHSHSSKKGIGFNATELFDESEVKRSNNQNQTFRSRLPPRKTR